MTDVAYLAVMVNEAQKNHQKIINGISLFK